MKRVTRRSVLATGATALALSVAGCSGDGGTATTTTPGNGRETVEMNDELQFAPESVTVPAGTTVVWKNVGSVGHSVTAYEDEIPDGADYWASGGFDAESAAREAYPSEGDVAAGESYEHTFETAGTHGYFCIPHEGADMVGEVVVE